MPGNYTNINLHAASLAKKDEFYTQLDDIAAELKHYRKHFVGKVVLCNCDDPYESNFAKYFLLNFNDLGLKKLICTSYNGSPITEMELPLIFEEPHPPRRKGRSRIAYLLKVSKVHDLTGDGAVGLNDVKQLLQKYPPKLLEGNGDFRSPECIKLLKEADIVVTNPPFSLFREYVAQLMEYKKEFLILGNKNAISYREIFPLIKENKMWVGVTPMSKEMYFFISGEYIEDAVNKNRPRSLAKGSDGRILGRSPSIWLTNLDHNKRHEELDLYEKYSRKKFPKYDNYDAINVDKTVEIPCDYDGVMGVPITFLDKYNPDQFEILGITESNGSGLSAGLWDNGSSRHPLIKGQKLYARIFIRRK